MALDWTPLVVLTLVSGCAESGKDNGVVGTDSGTGTDTGGSLDGLPLPEEVFYLHDKAGDLAIYEDSLLVTTQHGDAIHQWHPDSGEDELAWGLGDLQGVAVDAEGLVATLTDSGVVGVVARVSPPRDVEIVADRADDGTLMRRPGDMAWRGGELLVADTGADIVWQVQLDTGAVEAVAEGLFSCVATGGGRVFFGGEAGVWELGEGGLQQLDAREARGLLWVQDRLLVTNTTLGLFTVEGSALMGVGPASPASMAVLGDWLYLSDITGGSVWRIALEDVVL